MRQVEEKTRKPKEAKPAQPVALPNMEKLKAKVKQRLDQKIQKIEHEIDDALQVKRRSSCEVEEGGTEGEGQEGGNTERRKELAKTIADIFGDDDEDSDAEAVKEEKDDDCELHLP